MIDESLYKALEGMTVQELQDVADACSAAVEDSFNSAYEEFKRTNEARLNSHSKDAAWFRKKVQRECSHSW